MLRMLVLICCCYYYFFCCCYVAITVLQSMLSQHNRRKITPPPPVDGRGAMRRPCRSATSLPPFSLTASAPILIPSASSPFSFFLPLPQSFTLFCTLSPDCLLPLFPRYLPHFSSSPSSVLYPQFNSPPRLPLPSLSPLTSIKFSPKTASPPIYPVLIILLPLPFLTHTLILCL
jgi:hypothetical protein